MKPHAFIAAKVMRCTGECHCLYASSFSKTPVVFTRDPENGATGYAI
jgi:hypothetical protein